ncbi:hypothetical protein [Nocardiopsis aegyptia]|uniref:Uncharacterized protein n=1 Tax=Nocardiopsis aegyptia TaxID=220378 RepID=A0A7Z0EKC8_9ACTN|nr:hypothetical protein [Nocardiopsis aegyptia]NYJ33683.1 hypothetical protein [Nocardiopsis aegyptia]
MDPAELTGYEFQGVASIAEVTIPRLARRLIHGARARAEGTMAYLENGEAVS